MYIKSFLFLIIFLYFTRFWEAFTRGWLWHWMVLPLRYDYGTTSRKWMFSWTPLSNRKCYSRTMCYWILSGMVPYESYVFSKKYFNLLIVMIMRFFKEQNNIQLQHSKYWVYKYKHSVNELFTPSNLWSGTKSDETIR